MRRNRNIFSKAHSAGHGNCNCGNKHQNRPQRSANGRPINNRQATPVNRQENVETGHYDGGAALSLSYDDGMHPVNSFSAAHSQFTFGQDNYYVQPFDENTNENPTPSPATPPNNSNNSQNETPQTPPKKTPPAGSILPPADTAPPKLPKLPGNEPPQRMPVMPGEDAPETMPVRPGDEQPIPMQQTNEDENFAADLTAILQGQKQYDAATKQVMPRDRESQRRAEPPSSRNPTPVADEFSNNEHAIFDKIAQSMKLANAYDLGTVALEQRFDSFDETDEAKKKVNH